ncbi:MAG: electron transporter RnfB [Erysipelotrichaceae bacterium]|nr:electron transporter RnfB [Erysipelotrichaceae bacterium]
MTILLSSTAAAIIGVAVMLVLGALLGLGLAFASKKFAVKEDERLAKIIELLPNANCGSCGYPGCSGLAQAILDGEVTSLSVCRPMAKDKAEELKKYLSETPGPEGTTINLK